ncbi:MAG TPA: hypothetical protein VGJ92_14380 [Methanocella sp.]|jgi:hypothetical protein
MNEKLIDEYLEKALKDVPQERRDDAKADTKVRIMEKVLDRASAKKCPVNDDLVAEVLRQWPPYRPLKAITASVPVKAGRAPVINTALVPLVSLVLGFIILDVVFLLLAPETAGVSKADVSSLLLAVALALITAVLVIGAIFASMYLYNNLVKKSGVDQPERIEKIMKDAASPVRVCALTVATIVWIAILYLWWRDVAIPSFDKSGAIIPFFSEGFASFVPLILALGIAMILVNVLYLVIAAKWLVSLAETVVNAGVMLIFYLMIHAFPFNAALPEVVKTGIYLMLCLVFLGLAFGVAKNLLQTMRFMDYSSGGTVHHKRSHL